MSGNWVATTIGDCLDTSWTGRTAIVPTGSYQKTGKFPVIDQGVKPVAGWTDNEQVVIADGLPLVLFGDHTRALKYVDFPFARGADGTQLLRTKESIDTRFFYYACRSVDLQSRGYNRHFSLLREQEILLPTSLEEQRTIAWAMHLLEQAVAVQAELVETTRALRRRVMADMFAGGVRGEETRESEIGDVPASWDVVEFRTIREDLRYGTSTRCTLVPAAYPVLRIPNILSARIDPTELKYCDMDGAEAERYALADGDLIFIRTNGVIERLGLCAVYRGSPENALFASYLIRARLLPGVDPDFIAYFFGSDVGINLISSRATPAADGKYNLNTGIIDSLQVPIPPLDEQREIAAVIRACDQKIEQHRRKLATMQELFKRLLSALMTGEVDIDQLAVPASAYGSAA